jgi:predicted dehydrogenase/threonine dehydrogenase-like Zn-dependent dehydrogenase
MKAVLQNLRSGQLEVCEVPVPELRFGGVLVRTLFSAISAGTERAKLETGEMSLLGKALARRDQVQKVVHVAQTEGVLAAYRKVKSRLDSLSPLGYSCAGVVLEVGEDVNDLRPGDRVACGGVGYANHSEINFVPRNLVARIPEGVALQTASLTTIGAIAVQGLRQADVRFGESVAVIGAGLVGLLTIQLARAAGCRVLALDVDSDRAKFASTFGAHLALVSNDVQISAALRQFSPVGLDVAIITAASPSSDPLELAADILRDRGRITVVGDVGMGVSRRKLYDKELSIALSRSYGPGRYDVNYEERGIDYPIGYVRWTEQRNLEAFLELLARGSMDLSPLTLRQCDIADAETAYNLIREKKAYTVILRYPGHQGNIDTLSSTRQEHKPFRAGLVHSNKTNGLVRASCIGAGGFARDVVFPHLAKMTGVRLRAVATSSGYSSESALRMYRFEKSSRVDELLDDEMTDVVFVLSRHDSHTQYVRRALAANKAVFCEKPLAVNRTELRSIVEEYEAEMQAGANPWVMVGFNRRFAPCAVKIRDFFASRHEPMMIHIRINAGLLPRQHWTHADGGRIIGEMCHFVDFARALVNCPIENVSASALPDGTTYSRDNVVANLAFADGSIANIVYVANGDKSIPKEYFEIFCGGAIARLDDFRTLELVRNRRRQKLKFKRDKGHYQELELTVAAVRNGGPAPIPFAELVEVTDATFRVAEAVGVSLELVESSAMVAQI